MAADKVRQLQNRLWAAAKQSPGRRFHALYDRIYRSDVLLEAWERVRANRGAAGVDGLTLAAVEDYGVERMLDELPEALRAGIYRPAPVRRVEIPKPDGRSRPLGHTHCRGPSVPAGGKDRPRTDLRGRLPACSFGFRPKRSATDAMEKLRIGFIKATASSSRPTSRTSSARSTTRGLLSLVEERVSDRRVLKLLRQWLRAGVLADGVFSETVTGTPQGGVISPLLANIYLHAFDRAWAEHGVGRARPLRGRLRRAVHFPGRGRASPASSPLRSWATSASPFTRTRPVWSTSGRARRALTSSGVTSTPACPASSGSSGTSSATTCNAGRHSGR